MDETTKELIESLKTGDKNAFNEIYQRESPKLYRMAYLISGNKADSEDILQETFVKCFLYRDQIKEVEFFNSWLAKILVRTAWRLLKKKKQLLSIDELMDNKEGSGHIERIQQDKKVINPLDAVIFSEFSQEIKQHVQSLNLKLRTVVVLYYYQDLSVSEIARITGSLEGTVKSRLYTARKKLKEKLTASNVQISDMRTKERKGV